MRITFALVHKDQLLRFSDLPGIWTDPKSVFKVIRVTWFDCTVIRTDKAISYHLTADEFNQANAEEVDSWPSSQI